MITLPTVLAAYGYKLDDVYDYGWDCFGSNSKGMEIIINVDSFATVVFNKETGRVFNIEIAINYDKPDELIASWTDPEYIESYKNMNKIRVADPFDSSVHQISNAEDILDFIYLKMVS